MLQKLSDFVKRILKKEEEYIMPNEYAIVQLSELSEGEIDDGFKEIIVIKGSQSRTYPYSELLLDALVKVQKLPVHYATESKELPVHVKIEPGVIEYAED